MRRLHRFSVRHPVLVLVIAALVTAAVAPGIARLKLRTDGHALIPRHAKAVALDDSVRAEFGVRDPLVVLVRPRVGDIFNPPTLHLIAELTATLARIPGLDSASVRSLATERSDHFRTGSLMYRRLLEPVPETAEQLAELRGDLKAIRVYTGTMASFDGGAAAIHLGVPPGADRPALFAAVREVLARANASGHDLDMIGAPVAEALLGTHILEDLGVSWRAEAGSAGRLSDRPAQGLDPMARLRLAIARHLGLLPLSILVMALVFVVSFRSLAATVLPLVEAGACLVIVFGLLGWTGVPVYLTMAVLPVILVSMGLADEIHVFACYRQHRAARPDAPVADVVRSALDEMCMPVVATSVTTAIGFLSFAISPLEPVRAFGLFTSAGILLCMLWTLTVIPAMLVLFAPRVTRTLATPRVTVDRPGGWGQFAAAASRWPALILVVAVLALAITPFGIRRLAVQDSWISGFARESDFYRATQYFNQHFYGTHRLLLALDTDHIEHRGLIHAADIRYEGMTLVADSLPDPERLVGCSFTVSPRKNAASATAQPWMLYRPASWESFIETATARDGHIEITTPLVHGSPLMLLMPAPGETLQYALHSQRLALPSVLRRIQELEQFARAQTRYTVGGVLGPADQIETAGFLIEFRDAESRSIPSNPDRIRWLWSMIRQVQGPERRAEVVDSTFQRGLVTVYLKNANYIDTQHLMDALRHYEREHLAPERIRMEFAGDVAVSQALIDGIVRSQVGSIVLSLLGIFVVITVMFRSLRWGAICMVPAGLSVAATFAVMGWVAIPLGVASSMFAGMVLGIGVDFAIHIAARFRRSVAEGLTREAAISESLRMTGPAIVTNALAITLGFGILLLSRVPANAQLGAITVVSLATCVAATLLVLPALLRVAGGRVAANEKAGT